MEGKWVLAAPAVLANLSATGYYFSRNIQVELGTPVGFINASWGGSPVEAWTSMESLSMDEELGPSAASITQYHADFPALTAAITEPAQEQFSYSTGQDLVDLASGASADVHGHTLVWFTGGGMPRSTRRMPSLRVGKAKKS